MQDYEKLYKTLKEEYETYQIFSEAHIQELVKKNIKLEKKNDFLSNVVEISGYINTFFGSDKLLQRINDMIIGILGVTYSTIFLIEDNELQIKISNIEENSIILIPEELNYIKNEQQFLLNSKQPLKRIEKDKINIHSIMGVPIKLKDKFKGYIIVEHSIYNFMNVELQIFLQSIANQISIAIENSSLYIKLRELTKKDILLDIYNRKYFFEFLNKVLEDGKIDKFAIVMVDIDDFKKINDTYGHQFGDEALINTSKIFKRNIKQGDVVARYGGEELILFISNFENEDEVYNKIEKIRREIENSKIQFNNKCKSITASFGISFFPQNGKDAKSLIKIADNLLYKAKYSGKNKVLSSYIFTN